MMQRVEDNMSDLENRKFLIIEYMIQTNLMSERHTSTHCCFFLCHSLMSHNWSVKVKQQKKPLMNILRIIAPWKSIMRVYKECFKHNLK